MRSVLPIVLLLLGLAVAAYGTWRLANYEPWEALVEADGRPSEFKTLSASISTEVPAGADWLGIAMLGVGALLAGVAGGFLLAARWVK